MKLKPIPENTVVHTPTEEEAKELLAILHENGYKWAGATYLTRTTNWHDYEAETCYNICVNTKNVYYCYKDWFIGEGATELILTLSEFKSKYCEEEKPRETDIDDKFHCGDKVITAAFCPLYGKGWVGTVVQCHESDVDVAFGLSVLPHVALCDLEPYAEPETKDDAKDEAKEAKGDTKELNLCDLLKGHEGENIFLTTMGNVFIESVSEINIRFKPHKTSKDSYLLKASGKMNEYGLVIAFPSRALYEQYPLDPLKAWSEWQEEQEKWKLRVGYSREDSIPSGDIMDLFFRTPADRDKCIEEIKAVIEKYSK